VNEAMLCGCPVAVTEYVGAKFDLRSRWRKTDLYFPAAMWVPLPVSFIHIFWIRTLARAWEGLPAGGWKPWSPREFVESIVKSGGIGRASRPRDGKGRI